MRTLPSTSARHRAAVGVAVATAGLVGAAATVLSPAAQALDDPTPRSLTASVFRVQTAVGGQLGDLQGFLVEGSAPVHAYADGSCLELAAPSGGRTYGLVYAKTCTGAAAQMWDQRTAATAATGVPLVNVIAHTSQLCLESSAAGFVFAARCRPADPNQIWTLDTPPFTLTSVDRDRPMPMTYRNSARSQCLTVAVDKRLTAVAKSHLVWAVHCPAGPGERGANLHSGTTAPRAEAFWRY